jgi:hypothetical protein
MPLPSFLKSLLDRMASATGHTAPQPSASGSPVEPAPEVRAKIDLPVNLNELSRGHHRHLYPRLKAAVDAALKAAPDNTLAATRLKMMRGALEGHIQGRPQGFFKLGDSQDAFLTADPANEVPLPIAVTADDITAIDDRGMAFRMATALNRALAAMPEKQPHPVMPTHQSATREQVKELAGLAQFHARELDQRWVDSGKPDRNA